MAGLFGQPEWLKCCCEGTCPGCCMPVDEDGNALPIPFEIDAPGCAIDGFTGEFDPLALSDVAGQCGICGTWGYGSYLSITGSLWNFNGIDCDLIPGCALQICMFLNCDTEHGIEDDQENGTCCRRMRLYVATTYRFDGATNNNGTGQCSGLSYETWLSPDSCECSDNVLSAIFSLGILDPATETNPECGEVQPCVPDCAMSGIKVLI